jgi:hypothetical protein
MNVAQFQQLGKCVLFFFILFYLVFDIFAIPQTNIPIKLIGPVSFSKIQNAIVYTSSMPLSYTISWSEKIVDLDKIINLDKVSMNSSKPIKPKAVSSVPSQAISNSYSRQEDIK